MPHTKSAAKRLRQSLKRRDRNRAAKKTIRLQLKKFNAVVKSGSIEEVVKEYNETAKTLDKYAARRVIHRNTAARKKSQLARLVNARKAAPPPPAPTA